MPATTAKKSYRRRVNKSTCRNLIAAKCRHRAQCKYVIGKTRKFCRKLKNAKRVKKRRSARLAAKKK